MLSSNESEFPCKKSTNNNECDSVQLEAQSREVDLVPRPYVVNHVEPIEIDACGDPTDQGQNGLEPAAQGAEDLGEQTESAYNDVFPGPQVLEPLVNETLANY